MKKNYLLIGLTALAMTATALTACTDDNTPAPDGPGTDKPLRQPGGRGQRPGTTQLHRRPRARPRPDDLRHRRAGARRDQHGERHPHRPLAGPGHRHHLGQRPQERGRHAMGVLQEPLPLQPEVQRRQRRHHAVLRHRCRPQPPEARQRVRGATLHHLRLLPQPHRHRLHRRRRPGMERRQRLHARKPSCCPTST